MHAPETSSGDPAEPRGPADPSPHPSPPTHRTSGTGSGWVLKIALEVALISVGVFLALMGDQWRERAQQRELAESSLRAFRTEIVENRKAVAAVTDYHVAVLGRLRAYLAAAPGQRQLSSVRISGLRPVFFDQTAWDLAIATQALAHIDQTLAFELSRVYGLQRAYTYQTRGMMQSVFMQPFVDTFDGLTAYYGDLVIWEPRLLQMYDALLPRLDAALGATAAPVR